VNIGVRQKGRLAADSVIHSGTSRDDIIAALQQALSPSAKKASEVCDNPYGSGDTSTKIIDILKSQRANGAKRFHDISWAHEE